jgi:hypothetical protein
MLNYIENNPSIKNNLVMTYGGMIMFGSQYSFTKVAFNPQQMTLTKDSYDTYTIRDTTGRLLLERSFPLWNLNTINTLALMFGSYARAFGSTGDIFWFDPVTGMLLYDASGDCRGSPEIMGKDGNPYLSLIPQHPNVANAYGTDWVFKNKYRWKNQTTKDDGIVFYFTEPGIQFSDLTKYENPMDLKKYPLGEFKREFQSRRNLVDDKKGIVTVHGIPMILSTIIGAQEPEIWYNFKEYKANRVDVYSIFNGIKNTNLNISVMSLTITMILIIILMILISFLKNTVTLAIADINNEYKKVIEAYLTDLNCDDVCNIGENKGELGRG